MDQTAPVGAVGHRVARQRGLTGLSRSQLATRSQVSVDVITQVERGVVAASPAFTAAVARALEVEVDTLYGQPYGPAITDPTADHAGIPALRVALDYADDPMLRRPPMTALQLRARLDRCGRYRASSRYAQLTTALPELLQHGYVLAAQARPGTAAETAWALLADAYLLAQTAAYRFGYLDLAALCNEYARQTAGRCGDPLRAVVAACAHALLRLHRGDYNAVNRALERAHTHIADQHSPAADSVRTQLHLRQSLAHARSGSTERAEEHIKWGRDLAALPIPPHAYYTVTASPANVDIHWVAVPVELGDATTALHRAEQVQLPADTAPSRVGHHWIDLARAATLHGDQTRALDALNQARAIAPQLTRYHPQVQETVHLLAEADRRDTESLAGFAHWTGVIL